MRSRKWVASVATAAMATGSTFAMGACSGSDDSVSAPRGSDAADQDAVSSVDARPNDAGVDGTAVDAADANVVDAADAADAGCTSTSDTSADPANCGACGYGCVHGRTCVASRCSPAWQPLATANVPTARNRHAAAALGTKFIATGGAFTIGGLATSGAASYDLATDTWATYPSHVAARLAHDVVSSGTKLYAFGGITDASNGATVGPALEESSGGAWTTVNPANPPMVRYNFTMAWTGTEVMLYGGDNAVTPATATGSRLVPGGSWVDAACPLSGCERGGSYTLFRDGPVMRVFGGGAFGNAPAGLQYNLATKTWSAWAVPAGGPGVSELPKQPADDGRRIFWVREPATCTNAPSILVFDRKTQTWGADTAAPPAGLLAAGAVAWVGKEVVVWSGDCGGGATTVGGRYQPAAPPP